MKIDLGHGAYLEPDEGPRNSPWHRRILSADPIPNTRSGQWLTLECGHRSMAFGNLAHAEGRVMCLQCRDIATPTAESPAPDSPA
jgi:hypothetical protein